MAIPTLRTAFKALLIAILFLAVLLVAVAAMSALAASRSSPQVEHTGPTIESVRSLAALVTTRVTVADAAVPEINGVAGYMDAVLVIRGDAILGVDLERARIRTTDPATRSFIVILPQPRVIQARVDHEHTRIFAIQRHWLWNLMRLDDVTRQLLDAGMKDAQRTIERAAATEIVTAGAREHAEHVLQAFAQSLGWNVTVQWLLTAPNSTATSQPVLVQ